MVKVEQNDLTLKITGGRQQAVDVVRRTVSQRERQQLLPGLQVCVSFALTQQTAHIPGQTVAWRKEKAGTGSHEVRQAVTEAGVNLSGRWRQTLNLKMQRWCDMDTMGATFTPQLSLISVSLLAINNNQLDSILTNRLNSSCCCSQTENEHCLSNYTFPFSSSAFPQCDINKLQE